MSLTPPFCPGAAAKERLILHVSLRQNPRLSDRLPRQDSKGGSHSKDGSKDVRRTEQMLLRLLAVALLAPALAACSAPDFSSINPLPNLSKAVRLESLSITSAPPPGELRPVTAADLVGPQGQCAGSGSDTSLVQGGIALEMTECEVVKRAGTPEDVQVGTNGRGERTVTLTYNSGPRPGIYHFTGGRLYDIDRVEQPSEPPKPTKPKKPAAKKQA